MTRILFAVPGDLEALTGGYEYDRRILRAARDLGAEMVHIALSGAFPSPARGDVDETVARVNEMARAGDVVLMDGLALGVRRLVQLGSPSSAYGLKKLRAAEPHLRHARIDVVGTLAAARALRAPRG